MKRTIDFCQKNLALVLLVTAGAIFSATTANFFTLTNILNILNQNAYTIIAMCGVALIMIGGDLDMSVGYHMSICGVLCAMMLTRTAIPVPVVVALTVLLSVAAATLTTFLTELLAIPRIFVTIGEATLFQGCAYVITNSKTISNLPAAFKNIAQGALGHPSLTYATLIMAVFVAAMSFTLSHTYFGRHVFSMGGNLTAARLAGINTRRMKYIIGILVGFFLGVAAVILIGRTGAAAANTAAGVEINILTGILLGGVSIRGGEGKISNCVAGILLVALISNGMQLAGWNPYYQYIAKGVIMLCALGFDMFQMRRRSVMNNQRKEEIVKTAAREG
ncbi:MAG: ABC transporter permease [Oscillospiraceae bacterium]|jgi:ribose/xylose/arabinose/galactoside ABC-type transport system permease subunit|nr:ABC transporter permease [Oscillospiraceae bacterium]